ncbi:RNA polymerase sigma-70 factor (ECF subfamily) [Alkalihalobacillus xiaoxiensis]|uniref:RNA polymerase sigma-70 factor (ECF subfamily) n=1 Tax=Shouchella xiaoxiensis TaxID=766895 RepID=A0ABS2T008_9BACI|nr:RNA polymerase sigma-70 factor (ECF subfamily) [Shouchella xiaoxiensis]
MNQPFNEAWQRASSSIWKTCYALTNHQQDAEDLMQLTWIKAFQRANKQSTPFTKAYFATIAKNAWIDEVRKQKITAVPFEDDRQLSQEPAPFMAQFDLSYLLNGVVKNLSIQQQVIFLMADVCQCSLKDIAYLTNRSVGAVKALLFRARQKITSDVREQFDQPDYLTEEDVLRVQLYSRALQLGDVQLLASLLSDTISIPALYVQQQARSSSECRMAA